MTYDKDTKRKQFTTSRCGRCAPSPLLWPMTKIQKESNSQRFVQCVPTAYYCCDLWQRYKKKAIHNSDCTGLTQAPDCCDLWQRYKKKAIHNDSMRALRNEKLLWPMTKIQKESNSQRHCHPHPPVHYCCDLWQRYKKKAIHNRRCAQAKTSATVVTYDKDTKRKQFTTDRHAERHVHRLLWPMTKIQKESNSQLYELYCSRADDCCDLWQRYKKKAIHNKIMLVVNLPLTVVTYDKDTKRKQFTTRLRWRLRSALLLWPMTKIQKESNSQRAQSCTPPPPHCCDLWQRYKKKAIHNWWEGGASNPLTVVTYDKDTLSRVDCNTAYPLASSKWSWARSSKGWGKKREKCPNLRRGYGLEARRGEVEFKGWG